MPFFFYCYVILLFIIIKAIHHKHRTHYSQEPNNYTKN